MTTLRIATWNVQKKPAVVQDAQAKLKCIACMVVRPDRDPMTWQDDADRGPGAEDPSIDLFALQEFPEDEEFKDELQQELDRLTTKGEYMITETRVSTPQGDESILKYWSSEHEYDSLTLAEAGGQPDHYVLIYKTSKFSHPILSDECVAYLGELQDIKIPIKANPGEKVVEVSAVSSCRSPKPLPMEKFIFGERETGKRVTHAVEPKNLPQWDKDKIDSYRRSCLSVLTDRRPLYGFMRSLVTGNHTFHVYNFHAPYKNKLRDPDWSLQAFAAYSFRDVAESEVQWKENDDVTIFLGDFNRSKEGVQFSFLDQLGDDIKDRWEHVHSNAPGLSGFDHILVRPKSTKWKVSLTQVPYWQQKAAKQKVKGREGETEKQKAKKQKAKGLAEQVKEKASAGPTEQSGRVYQFKTGVGGEFLSDHLWVVADLELVETSLEEPSSAGVKRPSVEAVSKPRKRGRAR